MMHGQRNIKLLKRILNRMGECAVG